MPLRDSIGSEFIKRGSVRSSHSSLNMPTLLERNEKVNVFDSPGFRMLRGYRKGKGRLKELK